MVGTTQGTLKTELGATPGEKLVWSYEGPVADRQQVYTPLTRNIDAVVASGRVDQSGGGPYSIGVYQTYTRADGSAYDRGSVYFSIYANYVGGGGSSSQDSAIDVATIAIGEGS